MAVVDIKSLLSGKDCPHIKEREKSKKVSLLFGIVSLYLWRINREDTVEIRSHFIDVWLKERQSRDTVLVNGEQNVVRRQEHLVIYMSDVIYRNLTFYYTFVNVFSKHWLPWHSV